MGGVVVDDDDYDYDRDGNDNDDDDDATAAAADDDCDAADGLEFKTCSGSDSASHCVRNGHSM